jgi:serine/threonine protein kinase
MLTKIGVKLMDFGLAKAMNVSTPPTSGLTATLMSPGGSHPLTAQSTVVRTFQYMSPEVGRRVVLSGASERVSKMLKIH